MSVSGQLVLLFPDGPRALLRLGFCRKCGQQRARSRLTPRPCKTVAHNRIGIVFLIDRGLQGIGPGGTLFGSPRATKRKQGSLTPFPVVVFCVEHVRGYAPWLTELGSFNR